MRKRLTCFAVPTSRSEIGIARNQPAEKPSPLIPTTAVFIFGWGESTEKRRIGQISWPRRDWLARSRDEFERAVQLNPKDVEARLDLAEFYIDAPGIVGGGEQKAREQARLIGALEPSREHWIYARIAEKKKDPATAEREYHQYIDLSHGDAEAWLNLALFFRHQKRFDEMEQAIVKLSQAPNPEPDVLWEASAMLERAGRGYPLATELVNRYLASDPVEKAPAFRAHYLRGALLEKQGDKAGAAREYRASLSLVRNFGMAQQALNRVAH